MAKTFVAVNDWCHNLLRQLTRRTPLIATSFNDGLECVHYQVHPQLLPEQYFSLVACHTLDGLPLEQVQLGCWRVRPSSKPAVLQAAAGFDATRLDRRCWGDLRLKPVGGRLALLSGELLVFGTGMLRCSADCGRHGKLNTKGQTVFNQIWALRREGSATSSELHKRVYESTNLIYGDAFGELEQLWDRRADMAFLDKVARALSDTRRWGQLPPSRNLPLNAVTVVQLHRRSQAIWNAPPRSGRALLRRLEFIMENTVPQTCVQDSTPATELPPFRRARAPLPNWRPDPSGYDGWLPGTGAALN